MGDVDGMAAAMERLISDASLRGRMMQACYRMTRSWCWPAVAKTYLAAAREADAAR